MTDYGVVPEGFRRKTLEEIKAEFEADQIADIRTDFDVSTASVAGQFNGIIGRQFGMAWELLEICYHGNDPDASEDRMLEMVAKLTGTFRHGNTPSEVKESVYLDIGTELVAGVDFVHVLDQPDIRFTPIADFVAPSTGMHEVEFQSEQTGPIEAFAGTLSVIATPKVGWTSAVNPLDAELGALVDTDPLFRLRRQRELATIGSATVRAITANVSQAFASKLQDLFVYENDGDAPDDAGRPPHSVEVVIFDGEVPSIDNDELAQVIFDSKAGGIKGWGNESGTAQALVNNVEVDKLVGFSRGEQLPAYLTFALTKGAGYIGDTAVKEFVATTANAKYQTGDDVIALIIKAMPTLLAGVTDVTSLKLGFAASPVGEVNLPVGVRQIARFDTSRIVIT